MAEFHLAASASGSWYCSCWLTVMLSGLTGTLQSSRAITIGLSEMSQAVQTVRRLSSLILTFSDDDLTRSRRLQSQLQRKMGNAWLSPDLRCDRFRCWINNRMFYRNFFFSISFLIGEISPQISLFHIPILSAFQARRSSSRTSLMSAGKKPSKTCRNIQT